ncbi:MAG: hypothetical protein FWG47_02135 [Propionibacteriaceae bacterium]|nr:hypothetical protein [Propionibacteriaceae bacterium]
MVSIQDVADAAHRIGESAKNAQLRTNSCADTLKTHATQLSGTVRGSRTGEEAVRQVNQAERSIRESAARLLTLKSDIDSFVQDLIK